ncbi:hypothetical protein BY458DRAFT_203618 [Sporodiniella umbellata]|nr:hypothetical protein BY458DRAFT_203618 [Sporodiniella umbellata]
MLDVTIPKNPFCSLFSFCHYFLLVIIDISIFCQHCSSKNYSHHLHHCLIQTLCYTLSFAYSFCLIFTCTEDITKSNISNQTKKVSVKGDVSLLIIIIKKKKEVLKNKEEEIF